MQLSYIHGPVQDCSNSIANTLELPGRGLDKILSWYISLDRYKISGRRLEILDR